MKAFVGLVAPALFLTTAAFATTEVKPYGFILNDQKTAFKTAKEEGKLLMIDFFGIWCPPCNQLDEHVFSAANFAKKTDKFVKLKLDADADVSWELKGKFKITGYPTVVFATPEGEEVGRIVGYRPLANFLKQADAALANRGKTYSALVTKADKGDLKAAAKVGEMEFERGNFPMAKKYLSLAKDKKYGEKIAISEIAILDEKADADPKAPKAPKTELVAALEKSIAEYPSSPESVDRRTTLAEKMVDAGNKEKQTSLLKDAIKVANDLITHPKKLEGLDYDAADLWQMTADANEKLGDSAASKSAWKNAVKEYRGLMKSENERGYSLELAYCLWKSGDTAAADALYTKFEALYPTEFTFFHAHANMYFEMKKYPEGQALEEKAFAYSYGDNKLRAGYNLARFLKLQGKKKEAIAVGEKTLAEVKLPPDTTLRTHRSAKKVQKLIDELKT
jgi:thioredoxin-like negative regulator of GroEL